jgi:hypothetical protein
VLLKVAFNLRPNHGSGSTLLSPRASIFTMNEKGKKKKRKKKKKKTR